MASVQELMDRERLGRTLARMAHEIAERHKHPARLALVGVRSRGVPLARRLCRLIEKASGEAPELGVLDITLYRDDLTTIAAHPVVKGTDIPFSIDGRTVVLVDDVLYTGRTVRAALDGLIDLGRPARIELAVLVDRGHRELPVRPDYVGRTVPTTPDQNVRVMLLEEDGEDRVVLESAPNVPAAPAKAKPRPARAAAPEKRRPAATQKRPLSRAGREAGARGARRRRKA
jgi:pyrimidine operon attenuation protein/uracil phosphoribosyltransferase